MIFTLQSLGQARVGLCLDRLVERVLALVAREMAEAGGRGLRAEAKAKAAKAKAKHDGNWG